VHDGRPVIGITADAAGDCFQLGRGYVRAVAAAGGLPIILPSAADLAREYVAACDGFVLSGGDDPDTTSWGVPLHPAAKPLDPERQAFECALLAALDAAPDVPVLGVCLGMQLMAIHAGGSLEQHLPDVLPTAGDHWGRRLHRVEGAIGAGTVVSHHRQAMRDAGALHVVATAPDGVIEAVQCEERPFYLGVQWHPERSDDDPLGAALFRRLVAAARQSADARRLGHVT
jgi:putative glutamine amidotransferase